MSENMTEFWKRFHISLSSWFHDYVFIRTVFKYRKWGKNASTFALFLTWILFGIWHGAGWNFMLLGLLQALAIYYEFNTKKWRVMIFKKIPDFYRKWISRTFTYFFYCISLVFFFAADTNSVFVFFSKLFQLNGFIPPGIREGIFILVLIFISIFLAFEIVQNDFSNTYNKIESFWYTNRNSIKFFRWVLYFLIITIVIIFKSDVQQFIYFQF